MQTSPAVQQNYSSQRRAPMVHEIRIRALERLYARRAAVDALISSLEDYQEIRDANRARCIPFIPSRKCS